MVGDSAAETFRRLGINPNDDASIDRFRERMAFVAELHDARKRRRELWAKGCVSGLVTLVAGALLAALGSLHRW